ncbi:MAG: hypothetical protein SFZ23_14655 [Planctomycetota bacterium]|nr:hypothetical protein [Planctomycetota bacterium]
MPGRLLPTSPAPDIETIGRSLRSAMQLVLRAIPDSPYRPTPLAQRLGLSRVTISKLLSALDRHSPLEMLERIPGPDSLRAVATGAGALGVNPELVGSARQAIDEFAALIRDHFGTRASLQAAIGSTSGSLRARVDFAGRADVFRGMRQVLGVEAETWLTCMFFVPGVEEDTIAVTTIHGALGLRRLKPESPVYFTFGAPYAEPGKDPTGSPISLQEFYTHEPAKVRTTSAGGQVRHQLIHDRLGKNAVADMLAVSHDPRGSRRYRTPEAAFRGVSLFVDIPVRTLVCDAIVHRDLFPGVDPELRIYNPGARGPANPNDPKRDMDRLEVSEQISRVEGDIDAFDVAEVPNYRGMVDRVMPRLGHPASHYRIYRLVMGYPVISFQFVMAFCAPEKPSPLAHS